MAVSYTHLDVYKRQFIDKAAAGVELAEDEYIDPSDGLIHCKKCGGQRPVSYTHLAKLFWVGIFAVLLGIYSVGVTLITGLTVGLSGLTVEVFFHGGDRKSVV